MSREKLGHFEQLLLLAALQCADQPYAIRIRKQLSSTTGRNISRGALYRTFDRLKQKGFVTWSLESSSAARGGLPRRRFEVSQEGLLALRESREVLIQLWHGLEELLERS